MGAMKALAANLEDCRECGGIGVVPMVRLGVIIGDEPCRLCGGAGDIEREF